MLRKLRTANEIRKKKGYKYLSKIIYEEEIRNRLPTTGYIRRGKPLGHDGVYVDIEEKLIDRFLQPPRLLDIYKPDTNIELGLRLGHVALTQRGDRVIVVGGGNGISATTAAYQVGTEGNIIVYDALTGENNDRFGISHIQRGFELNGVADRCETRHGLVGTMDETVELYSQKIEYEVPTISPASLPECDVLECDCNGMELDILRNMDIRPRVLIIEVEAPFYKESYGGKEHPRAVLDEIKELDYTIIQQYGHEGIPLTPEEFNQLIDEEYKTASKSQLAHGAKHSPIILAVDSNWKDEL